MPRLRQYLNAIEEDDDLDGEGAAINEVTKEDVSLL